MSHPTMGAWIEIYVVYKYYCVLICRTPRWVRGLKLKPKILEKQETLVAPHDGCVD